MVISDRFCFCNNLQKGSLVTGIVSVIIGMILIIFMIVCNYYWLNINMIYEHRFYILSGAAIEFVTAVLLICGVKKEMRFLLLPWLFLTSGFVAVGFLMASYIMFFGYFEKLSNQIHLVGLMGALLFALSGFTLYSVVGVAKYFGELSEISGVTVRSNSRSSSRAPLVLSRPPSYSTAVRNPAYEAKPPTYEEILHFV